MEHLHARKAWRRAALRRGLTLASVAVLAVSAAACGSDANGEGSGEGSSTVTVFFVDGDGMLRPVEHEVEGAEGMRAEGRAVAAVKALVHEQPEDEALKTHWAERCAAGAKVESLASEGQLVTLKVHGPAGVTCKRTGAQLEQQRQQLAWTVIDNLGVDASTPVRLIAFNDAPIWDDVVADKAMLAQ